MNAAPSRCRFGLGLVLSVLMAVPAMARKSVDNWRHADLRPQPRALTSPPVSGRPTPPAVTGAAAWAEAARSRPVATPAPARPR